MATDDHNDGSTSHRKVEQLSLSYDAVSRDAKTAIGLTLTIIGVFAAIMTFLAANDQNMYESFLNSSFFLYGGVASFMSLIFALLTHIASRTTANNLRLPVRHRLREGLLSESHISDGFNSFIGYEKQLRFTYSLILLSVMGLILGLIDAYCECRSATINWTVILTILSMLSGIMWYYTNPIHAATLVSRSKYMYSRCRELLQSAVGSFR